MDGESETLLRLRELNQQGGLGYVGKFMVHLSFIFSTIKTTMDAESGLIKAINMHEAMEEASKNGHAEVLENLKPNQIWVEFARYYSSIVRGLAKSGKKYYEHKRPFENHTLYIIVEDAPFGIIDVGHVHFHWNGSWEGLETEVRRDVEILKREGFNIHSLGYNERRDAIF